MKCEGLIIFLICSFFVSSPVYAGLSEVEHAFMEHDYIRAEVLAQEGLKQNSSFDEPFYQYYLGLSQIRLTKYGLAISALNGLVSDLTIPASLRDQAHLALIDAYYLDEKYDQAQASAQQFRTVNYDSDYLSTFYLKMARIKFKQAQWTDARVYLRKLINEYPDSLDVYLAKQFLNEKMYFSVQVGSFRDEARAKDLVSQLKAEGKMAYIFEVKDHTGQDYYRVRVGQMSFLAQAESLQEELMNQGYPTRIYP